MFLYHDLPYGFKFGSNFGCKIAAVKFKRGNEEVLLAALNHHGYEKPGRHAALQLDLQKMSRKLLGEGWVLKEGSDNYGLLKKGKKGHVIELFAHLEKDYVNALMQAFLEVIPKLSVDSNVKVAAGLTKQEKRFSTKIKTLLAKKVKTEIKHDQFAPSFY